MTEKKSIKLFRLPLTILLFSLGLPCMAQVPNDSIVADFRHFIEYLEETHPDPYTNYGGKALFHRSAYTALQNLRQKNVTEAEDLCWQIRSFLAPLQDGHTFVNYPMKQTTSHVLAPIAFRTIDKGIKEWRMWHNTEGEKSNDKIPTGNLSFAFIGKEKRNYSFGIQRSKQDQL